MTKRMNFLQGTDLWHGWRAGGVGGSDVPALFDASPYKTRHDLWSEKVGFAELDQDQDDFILQRGHQAEEFLRSILLEQTGVEFEPACFEKSEIYRVSLDGFANGICLETKLAGKDVINKAKGGEIPRHHELQIQYQLFASESDKAFWTGMDPKKNVGVVEIGRDEGLIKQIVDSVDEFWESVQKGIEPELSAKDTLFINDPNQIAIFEELKRLKKQKDAIEAQYSEIESKIKSMAGHPKVFCAGVQVTEVERSGSVQYAKVPELRPLTKEYLDQFRAKSSSYKKITFKKDA